MTNADRYPTSSTWLRAAVGILFVAAALKLGLEFWRLLVDPSHQGAIDLRLFHGWVHQWFAGEPVYENKGWTPYPPASYVLLWPFVGWLDFTPARFLWAGGTLLVLGGLAWLFVRESGARTRWEKAFVALMLLAMNATGVAIGNGQVPLHVLLALTGGLLLLGRGHGWRREWIGVGLVVVALVKPNITIPFLWLVMFAPGGVRRLLLVGAGYTALSLWAAAFQEQGVIGLLVDWMNCAVRTAAEAAAPWSYANAHSWAATLGVSHWVTPLSLLMLLALGGWLWWQRHADLWWRLGVTALVARTWTYHGIYDDVLVLLPMLALYRLAQDSTRGGTHRLVAGFLLGLAVATMLAPARLFFAPASWPLLLIVPRTVTWLAMLAFLVVQTPRPAPGNASSADRPDPS